MNRLIPCLLTVFACAAQAQQDYDPQSYGEPMAAPSTIPGQRGSGARVPQVRPAPNTPAPGQQRPPQRPAAPGGIQWGSPDGGMGNGGMSQGWMGNGGMNQGGMNGGSVPAAGMPSPGHGAPASASGGRAGGMPPATAPSAAAAPSAPAAATPVPAPTEPSSPPVQRQNDSGPRAEPPSLVMEARSFGSANAALLSSYRQLGGDDPSAAVSQVAPSGKPLAVVRNGTAVQRRDDRNAATDTQTIAAPALICAKNGNLPTVRRVLPAANGVLAPGAAFVVQGNCYGSAPGSVRVMLPTPRGRIRAVDANVLSWEAGKLFAELPADLQNVIPGEATVEVWAADGRRSAPLAFAFEPQWAVRPLPALASRVLECHGAGALNRCRANDDSEADMRFAMPKDCRSSGIGTCFGGNTQDPVAPEGEALIFGQHYTQDKLPRRLSGRDVFSLSLPPYLRASHCGVDVTAFETERGQQDATAAARFDGNTVQVDWAFTRAGEPGWLQYQLRCQVWAPVGVVLP